MKMCEGSQLCECGQFLVALPFWYRVTVSNIYSLLNNLLYEIRP